MLLITSIPTKCIVNEIRLKDEIIMTKVYCSIFRKVKF